MKNKEKILIGTTAFAAGFMGLGYHFFASIICRKSKEAPMAKKRWLRLSHMELNHPRNGYEDQYEAGKAWLKAQPMQDCYIRAFDGIRLHAYYYPAEDAKRIVLLCHGYKGSGFGDFANMGRYLHEKGCSLLFIDERGCGLSGGRYITFGAKEKHDIKRWAWYLQNRNTNKLPIYIYGESMGASAALMASGLKLPKSVKGIISDCAFHSMREQFEDMALSWFRLPYIGLMLLRLDFFCRIFAGFRIKDADTTLSLKSNRLPILFFHGGMDTFVQAKNTYLNYEHCSCPKEVVIMPTARHLSANYVEPEKYRRKIDEFFEKY